MKLGILVNTDRHPETVLGLTDAALGKGHEVVIFAMDDGTRLLTQQSFAALCGRTGVSMAFCDHSAQKLGVSTGGLGKAVVSGSQYDNASMMHDCDKVVVL